LTIDVLVLLTRAIFVLVVVVAFAIPLMPQRIVGVAIPCVLAALLVSVVQAD
jgi:hypothetical protein